MIHRVEISPPEHLAVTSFVELRAEAASNLEMAQQRLQWSTSMLERILRGVISAHGRKADQDAPVSAQMDEDGTVLPLVSWGVMDG